MSAASHIAAQFHAIADPQGGRAALRRSVYGKNSHGVIARQSQPGFGSSDSLGHRAGRASLQPRQLFFQETLHIL